MFPGNEIYRENMPSVLLWFSVDYLHNPVDAYMCDQTSAS